MLVALGALALATCLAGGTDAGDATASYLITTTRGPDGQLHRHADPYLPQPGDIIFFDVHNLFWITVLHWVKSEPPDHAGIVVRLPDGRMALLEAAPDDGKRYYLGVYLMELLPRLYAYGPTHNPAAQIYIRRLRTPLTREQSDRLTDFAIAQEGKRYALLRVMFELTPLRCHGAVGRRLFGKTDLNRRSWICSELAVAGGTVAGFFDPELHPANAMYPVDLLDDRLFDLSGILYPPVIWSPAK
jgi:hypothetical protein